MLCFMQKLDFQSKMGKSSGCWAQQLRWVNKRHRFDPEDKRTPPHLAALKYYKYSVLRLTRVWAFFFFRVAH